MAEEKWERCKICGLEWPDNALAECPQYRNSEHRKCRTNVRGQDVMAFVKTVDAPEPSVAPEEPVVEAEPAESVISDALWPLKGKKKRESADAG